MLALNRAEAGVVLPAPGEMLQLGAWIEASLALL
mgnify:CR=1 FL=1